MNISSLFLVVQILKQLTGAASAWRMRAFLAQASDDCKAAVRGFVSGVADKGLGNRPAGIAEAFDDVEMMPGGFDHGCDRRATLPGRFQQLCLPHEFGPFIRADPGDYVG